MASRRSSIHPMVEELKSSRSSPLRRKSLLAQKTIPNEFGENDDEAERANRRHLAQSHPQTPTSDRRRSFGLGVVAQLSQDQICEQINLCVKLSTENKINIKNAFALKLIDLMNYKVKKWDSDKDSFQVASTSLDVSTKIYGLRVDSVYNDVLKMDSNMEKQDKGELKRKRQDGEEDDGVDDENVEGEVQAAPKPKRKRNRQILVSAESLQGRTQTVDLSSNTANDMDSNRSDLLLMATLPHHAGMNPYLNPCNDVIFDNVNPKTQLPSNPLECPKIEKFDNLNMCSTFTNFQFLDWSPDDEPENDENHDDSHIADDIQVNLDASHMMDDDNACGVDYCDLMDTEKTMNVERCLANPHGATVICDLQDVIRNPSFRGNTEYSYFQDSLDIKWAGPSHWKIRDILRNRHASIPVVEGCRKEVGRRKKEVLLRYDDEVMTMAEKNFVQATGGRHKLQTKTIKNWMEDKITLPNDTDYDIVTFNSLFLKPRVIIDLFFNAEATPIPEKPTNYNLDESNGDFGDDGVCGDDHSFNDIPPTCDEEIPLSMGPTQGFTADNLVEAPKISSKIVIAFSQRAKKIDVRQLKKTIWKQMTSISDQESIKSSEESEKDKVQGAKSFREIFQILPKLLNEENAAALSVATTFMSVLHLANEKTLKIIKCNNNGDLEIRQD